MASKGLIKIWLSMGLLSAAFGLWAVLEFLRGHLWRAVLSAVLTGVCLWVAGTHEEDERV